MNSISKLKAKRAATVAKSCAINTDGGAATLDKDIPLSFLPSVAVTTGGTSQC
jgi:hypothetical protein